MLDLQLHVFLSILLSRYDVQLVWLLIFLNHCGAFKRVFISQFKNVDLPSPRY